MNDQPGAGGAGGYGGAPPPSALDIGDVFSTTFRTLGSAAVPIFACSLFVVVPAAVVGFVVNVGVYFVMRDALTAGSADPAEMMVASALGLAATLAMFLVLLVTQAVGQGGIVYSVVETMSGRASNLTLGSVFRVGISRAPALLLMNLLVGAIAFALAVLCMGPGAAASIAMHSPALGGGLMLLGAIAMLVVAFVAGTLVFPAAPACVVEKLGPVASLRRGFELTEGARLTIFLIILATVVMALVMACCVVVPIQAVVLGGATFASGGDIQSLQNPLSFGHIIGQLVSVPIQMIQIAIFSTLFAVVYARLRGIRDGVDAQAIASVFT